MKRRLGFVISFALLVGIVFGQILLSNVFTGISPRVEISSLDYNISNEQAFQYSDLVKFRGYDYSFRKETTGYVMNQPVNIIITNGNYHRFRDFNLGRGSFFTDNASQLGLNLAVISEDLSFQLFKTVDSLRNKVLINDITYTIVGVYKQNTLYNGLSSNGRNDIYIPSNSDFDWQFAADVGIQRLMIYLDENESNEFTGKDINSDLKNITFAIERYLIKDYSKVIVILQQFIKITGFIAAMMLIFLMCKYVFYELKKQVEYIREKLKNLSLKDILVEDLIYFLKSLISILATFIGIVLLYKLFTFSFYIPSKYISSVQLFDFTLYKQLVLNMLNHKNLYYSFKKSPYAIFYELQIIFNVLCMIFEVTLIIKLYMYMNFFLKENQKGGI